MSEAKNTFGKYIELVGNRRAQEDTGLQAACNAIEEMSCSDLSSLLTIISEERSRDVKPSAVIEGNRFHKPSRVSQRTFHTIETEIFNTIDKDTEFVELSTLQPFGTNTVLAGVNEKVVVAALRGSELNADATTALFRLAMAKHRHDGEDITLATNSRTTRAQIFDKNSKFLPHFKVFAEVSIGTQSSSFGEKELETLSDHLFNEVAILDRISRIPESRLRKIDIAIGNTAIMKDLIHRGLVNNSEIRQNTSNPNYDVFKAFELDIPSKIAFDDQHISEKLKDMGFNKGIVVVDKFRRIIERKHPDLLPRLSLDLGRIAGINYYNHMAYKIHGINEKDEEVPLADGGTTNWASKYSCNKQLYTVTSGIGTELIGEYFLQ